MLTTTFKVGDLVMEEDTGVRMTVKSVERGAWSGNQIVVCTCPGTSRPLTLYAQELRLIRAAPHKRSDGKRSDGKSGG